MKGVESENITMLHYDLSHISILEGDESLSNDIDHISSWDLKNVLLKTAPH